ncbi:MAG: EscU/YscU/HrcU family type III secretion system export apparatus switch protein [Verrucomicrobiota bacterium]|jgi:flagellar biosynthetic protein FlhB
MNEQTGEKTEYPTQRKLDEAQKHGQIARSSEVQTTVVLLAVVCAISFTGAEMWRNLARAVAAVLGHLHDTAVTPSALQGHAWSAALLFLQCTGPIVLAAMMGGLLAGGIQNRFSTASEALGFHWDRINPVEGLKRVFSPRSAVPALVALAKFTVIFSLTFSTVRGVLHDPVFSTSVSLQRFLEFLAESSLRIALRLLLAMGVIAAADYAYQFWRTRRDLMMTRDEIKEEKKNTEANQQVKAGRRRRRLFSKRRMLADVPKADVVITNPTHIAIALLYDRKTMQAPRLLAKGIRKNAEQIRELARQHGVPIVDNKPLARLMWKHGRVGREIPTQLYVAVAEVLAYVYRINPYRYYAEALNSRT